MKFPEKFDQHLQEAFEFWKDLQRKNPKSAFSEKALDELSIEKWLMDLLRQPIYSLIGQKRATDAAQEAQKDAEG